MWDLPTLKRLNEEREAYLKKQREEQDQIEQKKKVISLRKGTARTA